MSDTNEHEERNRACAVDGCGRSAHARGWCTMHYRRWQRHGDPLPTSRPLMALFWAKVRALPVDEPSACWLWTASTYENGYGQFRGQPVAHRFAYERLVGPIPDGMDLDHTCHTEDESCAGGKTCRHRRCVNPDHLEPVTRSENLLRGRRGRPSHCPQGHPYDGENVYIKADGTTRACRICKRAQDREYGRRQRVQQ